MMCFFTRGLHARCLAALLAVCAGPKLSAQSPQPLEIGPRHSVSVATVDGSSQVSVTGTNPHFWLQFVPPEATLDVTPILSFDYFSAAPLRRFEVKIPTDQRHTAVPAVTLPVAEGWRNVRIDLRRAAITQLEKRLLLDFEAAVGQTFRVRRFQLAPPLPEEQQSAEKRAAVQRRRAAQANAFVDYLQTAASVQTTNVRVTAQEIEIHWTRDQSTPCPVGVREQPIWQPSWTDGDLMPEAVEQWSTTTRVLRVPRFVDGRDRATSRWRPVVQEADGTWRTIGPAAYFSAVDGVPHMPRPQAAGIKGVGGLPVPLPEDHPVFDLGVKHATVNIVLSAVIRSQPGQGWRAYRFEGQQYFLNAGYLNRLDLTIGRLTARDILVSAILLVGNHRDEQGRPRSLLTHPAARPSGIFAMPAMDSPEATHMYRALMQLLAERYSQQQARIVNWILHNEVNQAGTWTNMGNQPLARYVESLHRSARLVHHTARLFDSQARVFVSLTHHWMKQSAGEGTYVTRDLLDLFARAARHEADFEWGVAYHPYPQPMFHPDVWNNQVTFDFSTDYITPRNIEVLSAYLNRSPLHWQGQRRGILLSEQGVNGLSLSPEDQRLQAAGIVYTMSRVRQDPAIEAYHYHNFRDHPQAEGGLLLGLREEGGAAKQAWRVYRAFESDDEQAVFAEFQSAIPVAPETIRLQPVVGDAP